MLKKDNFFKNYFINLNQFNKNLKKTKKVFDSFLVDLKNNQIPLLASYEKNYEFGFSTTMVNRFSKYKNYLSQKFSERSSSNGRYIFKRKF